MILYKSFIFFGTIATVSLMFADSIKIDNHTQYPIYVGIYYVKSNMWDTSIAPAYLQGSYIKILAQSQGTLERPSIKELYNREIVFSAREQELLENYNSNQYIKMAKQSAGFNNGTHYHIAQKDNVLHGYDEVQWVISKPIIEEAEKLEHQFLDKIQKYYNKHPFAQTAANVTYGNHLSSQEKMSTEQRLHRAHDALEKVLEDQIPLEKTPRIAVCMSGGGMRAAMCSYALMAGLDECGLLDAITYGAVLSGSTWFMIDWIYSGEPLNQYYADLIQSLSHMHAFSPETLAQTLWRKYIYQQDTSLVDVYGVYLGNTFLQHIKNSVDREWATFSSMAYRIADGSFPFPLCTAAETSAENHWVTFSPFNVSSDSLNFSIPTWSFGRKFVAGVSADFAPECSLGFFMGIWGSALSGSVEDMLKISLNDLHPLLYNKINAALTISGISDIRLAGVYVHSPLYGYDQSLYRKRNVEHMIFMDAGYICNLPIKPLLKDERLVDIIIVMDASQDVHKGASELKKAEAEIRSQGLPFPVIDYSGITTHPVNIFVDPLDPRAPVVIYMLPTKDDMYDPSFDPAKEFMTTYETEHFSYAVKDIEKLVGLIKFNIVSHKNDLVRAIKARLSSK